MFQVRDTTAVGVCYKLAARSASAAFRDGAPLAVLLAALPDIARVALAVVLRIQLTVTAGTQLTVVS